MKKITFLEILKRLKCDRSKNVRITVAKVAQAPEILAKLATDKQKEIRREVVKNRHLPL